MPDFSILNWNLYLGTDVSRVLGADPISLPDKVSAAWEIVNGTDFRARAKTIAASICREQPDVVALQEVCRWSSLYRLPLEERFAPEIVEYDFLEILLGELKARGESYFTAARSRGIDVLLPTAHGPDIRLEDSLVLLLRSGQAGSKLKWRKPRSGRFTENLRVTLDGEPFEINRGWASVDLLSDEQPVRIITTHLEYFSSAIQPAQLAEILNGPACVPSPVILTGDFNARPGSTTWQTLKSSGYSDAWEVAGGGPGHTAGQREDLRNVESTLSERIDWIMCRGPVRVLQSSLVGCEPTDRTADGMWPSDHVGISAQVSVRLPERIPVPQPDELIEVA
jgi:endonuclease/exonuclease/phosphatase family metal-dependent hydrolase